MTILLVSYPKSGTHLLSQILYGLQPPNSFPVPQPFFAVYESDGTFHTENEALSWMDTLHPHDVAGSHLYAWDRVIKRACQKDFVTYFLYRDPRDICVSYVFHVMEIDKTHYHHAYYSSLPGFDERLTTSILDVPGGAENISNIAKRFTPYLAWLDCPGVLSIKFTDLIHNRREILEKIISHFLSRMQPDFPITIETLEACIEASLSPTFREGATESWRKYFTETHKAIFKEVCGDLLLKLGYEKNNDW